MVWRRSCPDFPGDDPALAAPSPGGTRPVAFLVDATRIHVLQS